MTELALTGEALREHSGSICMAVSGPDMFTTALAARHRFVEFRLDSLLSPADALPELSACLASPVGFTAIGTCRRTAFGGEFTGSALQQVQLLASAARSGCILADIELETAEELGPEALDTLRNAGANVILSWHDFAGTPDLEPVLARMRRFAPDFYKIVPTAATLRDSLKVIDLLQKHGQSDTLIAMSMGVKGMLTRILGPRFGSVFTFASADGHEGTAPGQISVSDLKQLYRLEAITAKTTLYAVAGQPISGSKSPLMHNTAFAVTDMDAVYFPLETKDASELMDVAERLNIRGLSITMPLKEAVMPLLTYTDESVSAMGACNTIQRHRDGGVAGFNSDVAGIVSPLQRLIALKDARVLVLGAGGAARAAVFGLVASGAKVWVLNRTLGKAQLLAGEFGARVQRAAPRAETEFDVVINTTPYGMAGQVIEAPLNLDEINCKIFFDLVYNPLDTPFLIAAKARGIETIPGVAMFVEQGVHQFEIWTEKDAPEGDMMRVVLAALQTGH